MRNQELRGHRFAWAEAGEVYLIQSVNTAKDGGAQLFTHNYAKPGDRVPRLVPLRLAGAGQRLWRTRQPPEPGSRRARR